jgi:hypothetical protein
MRSRLSAPVPIWIVGVLLIAVSAVWLVAGQLLWGDADDNPRAEADHAQAAASEAITSTPDWREVEYAKLDQLRGGLSLDHFKSVLGTALFVTASNDGRYVEYLFQGRAYWVQAVADSAGSVALMSVTSCDQSFRPQLNRNQRSSSQFSVTLQKSAMSDVGATPSRLRYFVSAATANTYFYDEYYGGNPGNDKTYWFGINDACPSTYELPRNAAGEIAFFGREVELSPDDPDVVAFRRSAIVNTYAESGVFGGTEAADAFQVGADRILTRTAPPFPVQ